MLITQYGFPAVSWRTLRERLPAGVMRYSAPMFFARNRLSTSSSTNVSGAIFSPLFKSPRIPESDPCGGKTRTDQNPHPARVAPDRSFEAGKAPIPPRPLLFERQQPGDPANSEDSVA